MSAPTHTVGSLVFNRYVLRRHIAEGRLGHVWEAHDEQLKMSVALKLLWNHPEADLLARNVGRFMNLTHPNIVRVFDFIVDGQLSGFVMELVKGERISQMLADRRPPFFEADDVQKWARELFSALDYAWGQGHIVHGDLRLDNIIVTPNGGLKITEFALAPIRENRPVIDAQTDNAGFTINGLSPQILEGLPPTHQDDLYAAAALFYELLTSKPPFYEGNIVAQIHRKEPPSATARRVELELRGARIPKDLENGLAQCLKKSREDRPHIATDVLVLLGNVGPGTSTSTTTSRIAGGVLAMGKGAAPELLNKLRSRTALGLGIVALASFGFYTRSYKPAQDQLAERTAEIKALNLADKAPVAEADPTSRAKEWSDFIDSYEFNDILFTELDAGMMETAKDRLTSWTAKAKAITDKKNEIEIARIQQSGDAIQRFNQEEKSDRLAKDESADWQTRKAAWESYLKQTNELWDVGVKAWTHKLPGSYPQPAEMTAKFSEAKARIAAFDAKLKAEADTMEIARQGVNNWVGKMTSEWGLLTAKLNAPEQGAAAKLGWLDEYAARLKNAPAGSPPAVAELQNNVSELRTSLLKQAEDETPKEPLKLDALFAASPYSTAAITAFTSWTDTKNIPSNEAFMKAVLTDVQNALKEANFYPGKVDGDAGKGTHEAIIAFQKDKQLPATADLNTKTLAALKLESLDFNAVAEKIKAAKKKESENTKGTTRRPPQPTIYDGAAGWVNRRVYLNNTPEYQKQHKSEWNAHLRYEAWKASHP